MARQRFEPARGTRGSSGYLYYELSLAQGPAAIGVTGQNRLIDFIGTAWLLLVDLNRELHLFRQTATVGQWEEVTTSLPPVFDSPLPVGARRVSFAFDQSARIIVAYELAGIVRVTRWDAVLEAYVQGPDFAGADPFVVFDAVWSQDIRSSDVLLFYLTPDRERVVCRVQRQIFSIENVIHDYAEPVVLDRVVRIPLRYEVLVSDAAGEPEVIASNRVALVSDPYPYLDDGTVGHSATFASDDMVHSEALFRYTQGDERILHSPSFESVMNHVATLFFAERVEGERLLHSAAFADDVMGHSATLFFAERVEPERQLHTIVFAADEMVHTRVLVFHARVEPERQLHTAAFAADTMVHREA